MCGRFTQKLTWRQIHDLYNLTASVVLLNLQPRYNGAPEQEFAACRLDDGSNRTMVQLRWGLVPSWAQNVRIGTRLINARRASLEFVCVFGQDENTPTEEVRSESSEPVPAPLVEATEAVLEFPESVVWDQGSNAWYVSNFGGTIFADDSGAAPAKADENGFITKLSSNGEIDTLKWITGLHAPKGLGVHDGKLYAADVALFEYFDQTGSSGNGPATASSLTSWHLRTGRRFRLPLCGSAGARAITLSKVLSS